MYKIIEQIKEIGKILDKIKVEKGFEYTPTIHEMQELIQYKIMNIEKIAVNGHYIWVDKDTEVEEGNWYYDDTKKIRKAVMGDGLYWAVRNGYLKIIAASPELNLEGVPTYVEWLACQEYKSNHPSVDEVSYRLGFNHGYQAAEKELYTEDDLRKAIEMADYVDFNGWNYTEEEIIEHIKKSKK